MNHATREYRPFATVSPSIKQAADAQRAASAAAVEATRQAKAEAFEAQLRERFLNAGGSLEEWKTEGPGIVAEARKMLVLSDEDQALAASRRRYQQAS